MDFKFLSRDIIIYPGPGNFLPKTDSIKVQIGSVASTYLTAPDLSTTMERRKSLLRSSMRILSKFTSKHPSHPVCLPQELYGRIFQFVSNRSDLLALLYVSRAFCHEAEHILYENVDLSYNHIRIHSWFQTIASSPRLAAYVQSLTFGLVYSHMPTPALPWLEVLANGLRSLPNLKECARSSYC